MTATHDAYFLFEINMEIKINDFIKCRLLMIAVLNFSQRFIGMWTLHENYMSIVIWVQLI